MRQILHAHRDGKYAALDHPQAVVVDYGAQMIRVGLERYTVPQPQLFRFLAFMLRSADLVQHYAAINAAIGKSVCANSWITRLRQDANRILKPVGMEIEVIYAVGFQLHTEPKETLKCISSPARGPRAPSPAKSIRNGLEARLTTSASSQPRSTRSSPARSAPR